MISYEASVVLTNLSNTPRKSVDLQRVTGYTDPQIRGAVRELRLNGYAVCSGTNGFWMWNGTDDTWQHTKNNIKSRAKQLLELYAAMENVKDNDQVSFF